jgi:hypothetical protein
MDPQLLSVLIFGLTVLGGITLYYTVFGGQSDLNERLSIGPGTEHGHKLGAANADRLLRWHMRRLRETKARNPTGQKLPGTLTHAGFRGLESVARFQLGRFAGMAAGGLAGLIACLSTGKPWLIGAGGDSCSATLFPPS